MSGSANAWRWSKYNSTRKSDLAADQVGNLISRTAFSLFLRIPGLVFNLFVNDRLWNDNGVGSHSYNNKVADFCVASSRYQGSME